MTQIATRELGAELVNQLLSSPKNQNILLRKQGDYLELVPQKPKHHMTLADVARELDLSVPTVRRKYLDKHIKRGKNGFSRSEVMDLKERIFNGEL